MGGAWSSVEGLVCQPQELNIIMAGLEGSGKTTILKRLRLNKIIVTEPMADCWVESVQQQPLNPRTMAFTSLKVGFDSRGGFDLARQYVPSANAVVFVVDSCDSASLDEAKVSLHMLLRLKGMDSLPLLVVANKQDRRGAMTVPEVAEGLGLNSLWRKRWLIQGVSARKGDGLAEGLDWVAHESQHHQQDASKEEQAEKEDSEEEVVTKVAYPLLTPRKLASNGKSPCMVRGISFASTTMTGFSMVSTPTYGDGALRSWTGSFAGGSLTASL